MARFVDGIKFTNIFDLKIVSLLSFFYQYSSMLINKVTLFFVFILMLINPAFSQYESNYFSPLSKDAYAQKITEIKARKIVKRYEDKDEQKYFESVVKLRNESLQKSLEDNSIIHDTLLLNRCNLILEKIKKANPTFNHEGVQFFIYRSLTPNAGSLGDGSFYVNLGLFLVIENEDEMAMVLGHELAHYFLQHFEKRIDNNIRLLSSKDFKDEFKAIKKADDGKYLRFRKLMKEISTKGGAHSRFKESEADSLGVLLITKAGYNKNTAAKVLLNLEYSDDFYAKNNLYDCKASLENKIPENYFAVSKRKYNGLSTVEVTMNADADFDSIRTHPDCKSRYFRITNVSDTNKIVCCAAISKNDELFKTRALLESARTLYEYENFSMLIHLSLFAKKSGYDNLVFNVYQSLAFSGIVKAERELRRFSVTNAGAAPNTTLKTLQEVIFKLSKEDLLMLSEEFLKNNELGKEDDDFAMMQFRIELTPLNEAGLKTAFSNRYPKSKYLYLLNKPL